MTVRPDRGWGLGTVVAVAVLLPVAVAVSPLMLPLIAYIRLRDRRERRREEAEQVLHAYTRRPFDAVDRYRAVLAGLRFRAPSACPCVGHCMYCCGCKMCLADWTRGVRLGIGMRDRHQQ